MLPPIDLLNDRIDNMQSASNAKVQSIIATSIDDDDDDDDAFDVATIDAIRASAVDNTTPNVANRATSIEFK